MTAPASATGFGGCSRRPSAAGPSDEKSLRQPWISGNAAAGTPEHSRGRGPRSAPGDLGGLPQDRPGADAGGERAVARERGDVLRRVERRPDRERVVERHLVGRALGARGGERRAVREREHREAGRDGEEAGEAGGPAGRAMQRQQRDQQGRGAGAGAAERDPERGLEQPSEQDAEREAREERRGGERDRGAAAERAGRALPADQQQRQRDGRSHRRHVDRPHASRAASVDGPQREDDRDDRADRAADGERDGGRVSAGRARARRPPATPARCAIRATATAPTARPASAPGITAATASPSTNDACCAARGAAHRQAAELRLRVAAERAGGDPGEREQEQRRGAADEQDASRRRLALALGRRQRVVRRRQRVERARDGQPLLHEPLRPQQRVDAPAVDGGGRERGAPGVVAVEERERLEADEAAHALRHEHRLRRLAADGRLRLEAFLAERNERAERPAADDDEVDAGVVDPAEREAGELDHLAARGRAAGREPAGADVDDAGERVRGAELHEPVPEAHVGELDRARRPARRSRG